jgi:hypothetical protein
MNTNERKKFLSNREVIMKFKEKLLIFILAVVLSVLGFNLIASSSVNLLKAAKEAGFEAIEKNQAGGDVDAYRARRSNDQAIRLALSGNRQINR